MAELGSCDGEASQGGNPHSRIAGIPLADRRTACLLICAGAENAIPGVHQTSGKNLVGNYAMSAARMDLSDNRIQARPAWELKFLNAYPESTRQQVRQL